MAMGSTEGLPKPREIMPGRREGKTSGCRRALHGVKAEQGS
jgi:hypothetical protein